MNYVLLPNRTISMAQLALVGGQSKLGKQIYNVKPQTHWRQKDVIEFLNKKQLSINAHYWLRTLIDTLPDLSTSAWLVDVATVIPLRGSYEEKCKVEVAVKILTDYLKNGMYKLAVY